MSIPRSVVSGTNPSNLPPRYEIRQLTTAHIPWASAIVIHSNVYHSPVWSITYPTAQRARLHRGMETCEYLVRHQIESGMSFGVFDTKYVYKRPESASTHGALYWDETEAEASAATLLAQMDFPLVSIALSFDGANPFDFAQLLPFIAVFPLFGTLYQVLGERDTRDPDSWKARGPREVLMRNATSTRADGEGRGLMKKLAHWLMREAAAKGYRGIQIEPAHDAVAHTWMNPPAPFTAELVATLDAATFEQVDEDGIKSKPFLPSKQVCSKVYVTL